MKLPGTGVLPCAPGRLAPEGGGPDGSVMRVPVASSALAEHYTNSVVERCNRMFILMYTRDGQLHQPALTPGDTVVGRAGICDLAIDDPSISRRHVRFRVHGDRCVLTDLGGRNGTFVNGEQVTETEVRHGDSIVLGRFQLRVERAGAVVLSDQHSLVGSVQTLFRPVEEARRTAGALPAADSGRLLLLLSEISRHLVRWLPLQDILERIVLIVFDTVTVERTFLLLIDEATGEVVPRVIRTRDSRPVTGAHLSRTVIRRVIDDRVAVLATDVRLDSQLAGVESISEANIRSFMCAPLWNQNSVIGVLYVDNPHTAPFSAADLEVLQALSSYAAVAIEQARQAARIQEETRRREILQRYHSSAVVDRILAQGPESAAKFMAEERDVSVLFADIVGFTARAERMTPSAVAILLNRCFEVMCDAVFAEEGTLDKFIGDAILAVFGAPLTQPDHAARALRAAAAIRRGVAALDLDPPIVLRVAIHSGEATVGDIGSPKRREYTVLGDVVNTCSRLVSSTCSPGQIIVTAATRDRIGPSIAVRPMGAVTVRGRDVPVEIFEPDLEP
jgi:adenylate cyclase